MHEEEYFSTALTYKVYSSFDLLGHFINIHLVCELSLSPRSVVVWFIHQDLNTRFGTLEKITKKYGTENYRKLLITVGQ